jgi:hypothetical protein
MTTTAASTPVPPAPSISTTPAVPDVKRTIFHIAWLAILLGLAMEGLLLLVATGFGPPPQFGAVLADLLQKVSWASIVCIGLGFGNALVPNRAALVGVAGMLAGPLAFGVARSLHKSAVAALGLTAGGGPSPFLIAALKGAQYGALGFLVARLGRRARPNPVAHAGVGLATGVVFGGMILGATVLAATDPIPANVLLARGINEVVFPAGCALVLWTASILAGPRQ